ncbi:DUF654-domain-containing protein [Violaceomyces palustris]|uniref:DUF654-domain-containing protein n=1 Tax=Violaceomyces palustris TaxID=1673888 RepID=A0ACD0P588_9BASI|nr:DUF654-domain-containing protein [Violaceomyces palustris]
MSRKRLNKRQLREQQELEELLQSQQPQTKHDQVQQQQHSYNDQPEDDQDLQEDDGSEAEADPTLTHLTPTTTTQASIFATLGGIQDDQDTDEEEDEDEQVDQDDITSTAVSSGKKKKSKKKKKKSAKAVAQEEGEAREDKVEGIEMREQKGRDEDDERDLLQAEGASSPSSKEQKKSDKLSKGQKKKARQKQQQVAQEKSKLKDVGEMSIEELSSFLASQAQIASQSAGGSNESAKTHAQQSIFSSLSSSSSSSYRSHLALDPRHLDPAVELKRQFGSAAIKAYQNESGGGGGGRAAGGARARAQAMNPNLKVKSSLCTPKDYWPPIGRTFTGMSMDVKDGEGGRLCSWEHSRAYREVQMQFLQAVQSYDPNSLMALLRVYPWHIDTLLQLSEISRHQGDLGQAADFNDRALFAFERTSSAYFTSCLSSSNAGPAVVDFDKIENRAFFLAVHRNVGFLGRRGTWRTALEWSKLLLGLGKDGEDHHAALLWIDFLAIKSKQHAWLLTLIKRLEEQRSRRRGFKHASMVSAGAKTPIDDEKTMADELEDGEGMLDWCVGLSYAKALALKAVEREEGDREGRRSRAALRLAVARHPMVVPLICSKAGVDLPSSISGHPLFSLEPRWSSSVDTLPHLLSLIYTLRSESLWKEAGMANWLRDTTVELFSTLDQALEAGKAAYQPAVADERSRESVYRHIVVSDLPDALRQQLIGYVPPSVTSDSKALDAFDPVPPRGPNVTRYDDAYFSPILSRAAAAAGVGGPNQGQNGRTQADEQGMIQALMRALQGAAGIEGWGRAMEQMDDETREDVMAQILEAAAQARQDRGAGEFEPPGGFGDRDGDVEDQQAQGEEFFNDAEVERDVARVEGAGGGALGALRNALSALWGGGRQGDTESAEDSDWEEEQEADRNEE